MVALPGCGDDEASSHRIRGTVSYAGKPLQAGRVLFQPQAGKAAVGVIQSDGSFELQAAAGSYRVGIASLVEIPSNVDVWKPGAILQNYHDAQKQYPAAELLRRYFAKFPEASLPIDLYPLPGRKFDANNGIAKQISLGLVGGSWEWAEATPKQREKIWREHRSYAEGLLWFLANDPAVPKAVRDATARYGLAKGEFECFGHWPPALYVREARRMVGVHVLTQHDVLTDVAKPDPIAVGSFSHRFARLPKDSHQRRHGVHQRGNDLPSPPRPPSHRPAASHSLSLNYSVARRMRESARAGMRLRKPRCFLIGSSGADVDGAWPKQRNCRRADRSQEHRGTAA
jgi:hypothetical protein